MINIDTVAKELFSKIRGRFPNVTIGDGEGTVVSNPAQARFFEFSFHKGNDQKVSVSLDEKEGVTVMYFKDVTENEVSQSKWFDFLKELRSFSKRRMLQFNTRDITKSNLEKRDYKYLATRSKEDKMNESKLYGTSRLSYQNIGEARIVIKHTESINQELAAGRTQKIGKIYIESADGERFMYPYKHLSGARAMARHVAEGGKPYDDFGKHITGLSEELAKLRKFKTYMGRSAVMAESLADYMDVVKERIITVKKTIEGLQKSNSYKEAVEGFEAPILEEVPSDVAENWIDQLTIKQFNEELADVFPYIYKLVSEATRANEITPDDLDESGLQRHIGIKKYGKKGFEELQKAGREGASEKEKGAIKDKYLSKEEAELEQGFEEMMGQFSEANEDVCEECGNPSWRTLDEEKQKGVDGKVCWKGYKRMGTKMKGGKRVDNCVKIKDDITFEGGMKQAEIEVQDWFEKFNKYKGTNGDDLAQGWIRATLDSGIMSDGYEENEVEKFNKMKGYPTDEIDTSWEQDDYADFTSNKSGASPITAAMFSTINAIMDKYDIDEEDVDDMSKADDPSYGEPDMRDEGNAYANAVRQAKKDGKKKGDKIQGPDGDEITLEKDQKTPLSELILSYYDRETGEFPKGETAVLTMVEKDYGEQFIEPAKAFIEKINQTFEEFQMRTQPQQLDTQEFDRMRELAGLR